MVLGCCLKVRSYLVPLIAPHLRQSHMIPKHLMDSLNGSYAAARVALCMALGDGGYSLCFSDA